MTAQQSSQQLAVLDTLNRYGLLSPVDLEQALRLEHPGAVEDLSTCLDKLVSTSMIHRVVEPEAFGLSSKGVFQLKSKNIDLVSDQAHPTDATVKDLWNNHAFLAIAALLKKKISDASQEKAFACYPRWMCRRGMAPLFQFTYDQHIKRCDGLIFDGAKYGWVDVIDASIDEEVLFKDLRSLAHSLLNWKGPQPADLYVFFAIHHDEKGAFHKRLINTLARLKREVQSRQWHTLLKRLVAAYLITDEDGLYMGHEVEYLAKNETLLPKKGKGPAIDVTQAMAMMSQQPSAVETPSTTPAVSEAAKPPVITPTLPATKPIAVSSQPVAKPAVDKPKQLASAPAVPSMTPPSAPAATQPLSKPAAFSSYTPPAAAPKHDPLFIDKRAELGVGTINPRSDDWLLHKVAAILNDFGSLTFDEIIELVGLYQLLEQPTAEHLSDPQVISTAINELKLMRIVLAFNKEKRFMRSEESAETEVRSVSKQLFSLTEQAKGYLETQGIVYYAYTPDQHWERTRSGDYFYQQQGLNELCHRALIQGVKAELAGQTGDEPAKTLEFFPPHRVKRDLVDADVMQLKQHLDIQGAFKYGDNFFACLSLSSSNAILKLNQQLPQLHRCLVTHGDHLHLHYCLHTYEQDKTVGDRLPWANQQHEVVQRFLRAFERGNEALSSEQVDQLEQHIGASLFLLPDASTFDVQAHCYLPALTSQTLAALPPMEPVSASAPTSVAPTKARTKTVVSVATPTEPATPEPAARYEVTGEGEIAREGFDFTLTIGKWYYYDFPNFIADWPAHAQPTQGAGIFCPIGMEDDRIVIIGLPGWTMIERFYHCQSWLVKLGQLFGYLTPRSWQVPVYHIDFEDISTRSLVEIASPWVEEQAQVLDAEETAAAISKKIQPFQIVNEIRGDEQAKAAITAQQYAERLVLPSEARGIALGTLQDLGFLWSQGRVFYARMRKPGRKSLVTDNNNKKGPDHNKNNPPPPFWQRFSRRKGDSARKTPVLPG